ncbi:MAG: alpha/beta hydrolase [Vulcanimicrobiota bacterium]
MFTIIVRYPAKNLVLRTEGDDWQAGVRPSRSDGETHHFHLDYDQPTLSFKPCLERKGELHWAIGADMVAVNRQKIIVYPRFFEAAGRLEPAADVTSWWGESYRIRVLLPAGYEENRLRRYPVVYMQDAANLFEPQEAFLGQTWQVGESLEKLVHLGALNEFIVVGVYPNDRHQNYTAPGYHAYGRFVTQALVPHIDNHYRTLAEPGQRLVMGSSLGGVVSFFLAWEYPEIFGAVAAMSSTFSYRDDLLERVMAETPRDLRVYLDSGAPGDNYRVTREMALALERAGFAPGRDFCHLTFPDHRHDERSWAERFPLALQFLARREVAVEIWPDSPKVVPLRIRRRRRPAALRSR